MMRTRTAIFMAALVFALLPGVVFAQTSMGRGGSSVNSLTVNSNVPGANVYVNGTNMGQTPVTLTNLRILSFTLTVQAPGYQPYTTQVNVSGPTIVNAYLQSSSFNLSVSSNVGGAQVYINGSNYGAAPYSASVQPGNYSVTVRAPGYQDFNTSVYVSQNTNVSAILQPSMSVATVDVPDQFYNRDNRNPEADIHIFLDGRPVQRSNFQVPSGTHTIRVTSGGLSVQQTYTFIPGRQYTINLGLSMSVTQN